MATKKLQGDLDVIGNYKGNGVLMLTTADCAYDSTKTYKVGQVCSHPENKGIYTCIETATGTYDDDKWIGHSGLYLGDVASEGQLFSKYLNVNEAGQLIIDLTDATSVTPDDATLSITATFGSALFPASGTAADNKFLALLKAGTIRSIIWPSFALDAGIVAQVKFEDYFLDLTHLQSDEYISLACFSPACTLTIVSVVTSGSESTTVKLTFNDVATDIYGVFKTLISNNMYERITLDPVIAYMP